MVGLAWQGEMNSKVETQQSALDIFRWVAAAMVLVAAVAVFYTLSEASTLYAILGLLVALVLAVGIVWSTAISRQVRVYLADTRMEVRKVVWPTRQRTVQMTIYVLVMVVIVGIFLWLLDMFFLWVVELATGRGG